MGYVMVVDGIRNPDFGVPEVQMCKVKVGKNFAIFEKTVRGVPIFVKCKVNF